MTNRVVQLSKFLSYVLRHKPEAVGLALTADGWVRVDELLAAAKRHGQPLSDDELIEVVATNDKRRFAFNVDRTMIRAVQGHSVAVELGYAPAEPPKHLYHGTVERFVASIRKDGLQRGRRHHVHLSPDRETAVKVGGRRGRPVVLTVDAAAMHAAGHMFYRADNGVWLTLHVPAEYILD